MSETKSLPRLKPYNFERMLELFNKRETAIIKNKNLPKEQALSPNETEEYAELVKLYNEDKDEEKKKLKLKEQRFIIESLDRLGFGIKKNKKTRKGKKKATKGKKKATNGKKKATNGKKKATKGKKKATKGKK